MRRQGADVPDVGVLLTHTDHNTLMTWTTDNGSVGHVRDGKDLLMANTHGKTARGASSPRTRSDYGQRNNYNIKLTSN